MAPTYKGPLLVSGKGISSKPASMPQALTGTLRIARLAQLTGNLIYLLLSLLAWTIQEAASVTEVKDQKHIPSDGDTELKLASAWFFHLYLGILLAAH